MEDATGTLKLHKCKGPARPGGRALSNLVPKYYGQGSEACPCDGGGDNQLGLAGRRKKFFKKSECGDLGGSGPEGRDCTWVAPFVPSMFPQRLQGQGAGDTAKPR